MKYVRVMIIIFLCIAAAVWFWRSPAGKPSAEPGPAAVAAKAGPSALEIGMSQVFLSRAVLSLEQGDAAAAIGRFTDAIAVDPSNAKSYFMRGNVYWQRGQLSAAIADLSMAIEVGGQPLYYYSRCGAYFSVGEWDAAISDCSDTIRMSPMEGDAYFLRAVSHFSKGDLERALADSLSVLMIRPNDPNARQLLDNILMEKESREKKPSEVAALKTDLGAGM
jgi:tetratricopeptide (TPR) repeat protein